MDVKKGEKREKKNCGSMKADAATNINHNSVSKNIHTVSKFTLHSPDRKFSNTWCVNVNLLLHLVRHRCIFARCVNILTYVFVFTCAKYIPKYIYIACKYTYMCKFCACELHFTDILMNEILHRLQKRNRLKPEFNTVNNIAPTL